MPRATPSPRGRVPLWKDLLYAVLIVGGVLGTLTLYTHVWPPMVVVESGSMMHADADVPYGRFGTIDPGDMVLVKKLDGPRDAETYAEGGRDRFGKSGDVLVYYPQNNRGRVPIIHRAMTWVDVQGTGVDRSYRLMWEGTEQVFDERGIFLPELGFDSTRGYSREEGYKPSASGYLTRGDNPVTNRVADQAMGLASVVEPEWVQGKARGELPWFGLIKLAVSACESPPCNQRSVPPTWSRIFYAAAPTDLWVMLAVALAVVIVLPLAYDVVKARILDRRRPPGPQWKDIPPPPLAPSRSPVPPPAPEEPPTDAPPQAPGRGPPPSEGRGDPPPR